MESFLVASKAALSNLTAYRRVRVVLGNESCDLDSAVSALSQGLFEYLNAVKANETDLAVIPLMNINEREYRVKTEVVYYLKRHSIDANCLTFRDQIDLKALKDDRKIDLKIVLVDHHTLQDRDSFLADCVAQVIDHRPRDARWPWPGRKIQLEQVGSCATLVARNLFHQHPEAIDATLSSLLRGPILIDTCNFSKDIDRTTPADVEIVETLERAGRLDRNDRCKVFDEIVNAKSDISELSLDDLLLKDLKIAAGVPIVVLPMLVENLLQKQQLLQALQSFANSRQTTIVVLMGLQIKLQQVMRDIGIFSTKDDQLKEKILEAITLTVQPSLDLSLIQKIEGNDIRSGSLLLYRQGNLRCTRKHILPIVQAVVSSAYSCSNIRCE